jgi:predicted glutamine amidotransferase
VTAANTQPFIYTSPLETMIKIDNRTFSNTDTMSLLANENNGETAIKLFELSDCENRFVGFTRLGISADFKSWLGNLDVVDGIYGLKVYITTKETDVTDGDNELTRIYELTLSSEDMYGNPYNFESYFSQEKVFDISDVNNITNI